MLQFYFDKERLNRKKKKKKKQVSTGLTEPLSLIDPHLLLLNVGNCEFGAISVCIFIEWLQ